MSKITRQDSDGVKPLLSTGELGYDNYPAGGDVGRVYVGTGSANIAQAKKSEVDSAVSTTNAHIGSVNNPHAVTKAQVGLSNADNTSDNVKNVLSATKWTAARTITLSGDVSGSVSVDGSANVTMSTIIQPNSVALGTDTTGNYMVGIIAGSGLSVSHTQGEGSTATITNSAPNVTTDITTTHNSTNVVVNSSDGTDGTINAATQTLAGVMSAADKTKLDGIGGGTSGAQTANEILTLLNTVDGSGSGIDADLLDGQEGAYYLNASNLNSGTVNAARLPATITSSTTGNAATATKLATARTINGVAFDGTANIVAPTNLGITAGTTAGPIVTSSTGTSATLPMASATASGVVTTGAQTIAGVKTFSSAITGSVTGNSGTATKLATARTINGVAFDGTSNITISAPSDTNKLNRYNPEITGSITEQVYNLTGTEINPGNGTIQYKAVSSNTNFTTSFLAGQSVLLRLRYANSYTISFQVDFWAGGKAPELTRHCAIVIWKEGENATYGAFVGSFE